MVLYLYPRFDADFMEVKGFPFLATLGFYFG